MITYTTLGMIARQIPTASATDLYHDAADPDAPRPPDPIEDYPAMLCGEAGLATEYALGHDSGAATFRPLGDPISLSEAAR